MRSEKEKIAMFLHTMGADEVLLDTKLGALTLSKLVEMYEVFRANGARNYKVLTIADRYRISREKQAANEAVGITDERVQYDQAQKLGRQLYDKGIINFIKSDDPEHPFVAFEASIIVAKDKTLKEVVEDSGMKW